MSQATLRTRCEICGLTGVSQVNQTVPVGELIPVVCSELRVKRDNEDGVEQNVDVVFVVPRRGRSICKEKTLLKDTKMT